MQKCMGFCFHRRKRNLAKHSESAIVQLVATENVQLAATVGRDELPRGVRAFDDPARKLPFAVQWRIDGKRKTKFFQTAARRDKFARGLAADVQKIGVAAYRLDEDEARTWRAFVAQLDGASLDDVLACWHKHGKARDALPLADAIAAYTVAKTVEGVSSAALAHYRPVYARFSKAFQRRDAGSITREEIDAWISAQKVADHTRRTLAKRVRSLFRWLVDNRKLHANPCDGLRPVKITPEEVEILTVEQTEQLFKLSEAPSALLRKTIVKPTDRELFGRLSLEAFCGLRFSSAAQIHAADIDFAAKGITLPAAKIKTRRRQYIDGLPANLWAWLAWSKPEEWGMTPRDYMREKSLAFVRANVPHPHNCLRHSFASYHSALYKDASKTAAILCHTSPKMLYAHYKGRATAKDGKAYFGITAPKE